jgi:UDP-2,3-diacylglucosamine pyrophosphatase LpxH
MNNNRLAKSDNHIGRPFNLEKLIAFKNLVFQSHPRKVYFVGDTFDLLWCTWADIMTNELSLRGYRIIMEIINYVSSYGGQVFIIPGNHDEGIIRYAKDLAPAIITVPKITDEGILFLHGHQFDVTINIAKKTINAVSEWLPFVGKKIWGTPAELKQSNEVQYTNLCGIMRQKVLNMARQRNINIIWGHTHQGEKQETPEGQQAVNCGDGITENTYVIIKGNEINVRKL